MIGNRGPPNLAGGLIWKKGGIKYIFFFLGNDDFVPKNWDCILEKNQRTFTKMEMASSPTVLYRSQAYNQ